MKTQPLDDNSRKNAPGSFIELSQGMVHYQASTDKEKQPVILIHGLSTPFYVWDYTFKALSDAGFYVIRYDLYGRGFSDRPNLKYDADLFDTQLDNLITGLNISTPFDLVGLSMGGLISMIYTSRHSSKVRKNCLVDPLVPGLKTSFIANLIRTPVLGDILLNILGDNVLIKQSASDFYNADRFKDYPDKFKVQLQYDGYKRAFLSTLRNLFESDMETPYRITGSQNKPTVLFWGKQDSTIPIEHHKTVLNFIPHARLNVIDNSGHMPQLEQPDTVNKILIDFLND